MNNVSLVGFEFHLMVIVKRIEMLSLAGRRRVVAIHRAGQAYGIPTVWAPRPESLGDRIRVLGDRRYLRPD